MGTRGMTIPNSLSHRTELQLTVFFPALDQIYRKWVAGELLRFFHDLDVGLLCCQEVDIYCYSSVFLLRYFPFFQFVANFNTMLPVKKYYLHFDVQQTYCLNISKPTKSLGASNYIVKLEWKNGFSYQLVMTAIVYFGLGSKPVRFCRHNEITQVFKR